VLQRAVPRQDVTTFLHTISPTALLHTFPSPHFKTVQLFPIYFAKYSGFSILHTYEFTSTKVVRKVKNVLPYKDIY